MVSSDVFITHLDLGNVPFGVARRVENTKRPYLFPGVINIGEQDGYVRLQGNKVESFFPFGYALARAFGRNGHLEALMPTE